MREYIVSLKKDVDYQQFWDQIENESQEDGFVPSRRVDIVNNRDGSLRSCHYSLTDEEAKTLKNDPRVYSVEIPPQQRKDIEIGLTTTQTGNFTKTTSSSGNNINWGLIRNSNATNVYGTGTTTSLSYNYLADGTGVDVIIHDSGLQVDHPEFQDVSGNSRVQQINWYTASGITGTQSANHYRDYDGHGTHVAGIAAGKTYGWAKNARIYSIKVGGLEGSGDSGTGISVTDCFDVIKLWHRNKPIDPSIGRKRPTIVNMSWGYSSPYVAITNGVYRGTPWTGTVADPAKGMIATRRSPIRVGSIDVDLEELIDEGVIVCIAAGNDTHKIDVVGGVDYNNYWHQHFIDYDVFPPVTYDEDVYYHRGSSPYSTKAIMVGSLDSTTYSASLDQKSWFSNAGPGVDIFAAGSNIQSATSNINSDGVAYHLNPSYKQLNISGTSMASPQVTGIGAAFLQKNLTATPAQYKTWLKTNGTSTIYSSGSNNDYTNTISQYGGDAKVAYSFTAAGSTASAGVSIWSGAGGTAKANFVRLPPVFRPSLQYGCAIFPEYTRNLLYARGTPTNSKYTVSNSYIRYTINGYGEGALGDGFTGLGLQYDPSGTGSFGTDDYIRPGTPWEAYGVQAGTAIIGGSNSAYTPDFPNDALVWKFGGTSNHHVVLRGSEATGYVIVQYMTFPGEPIIRIKMTYQNTTGSAKNVKMMRGVDPDIDSLVYYTPNTNNRRGYGAIPATDLVYSMGTYSGKPLSLYLPGNGYTHNTAVIRSWPTFDFDSILAGVDNGDGDSSILGAWNIGSVPNGQSASVCCYYICSNNVAGIVSAIGE